MSRIEPDSGAPAWRAGAQSLSFVLIAAVMAAACTAESESSSIHGPVTMETVAATSTGPRSTTTDDAPFFEAYLIDEAWTFTHRHEGWADALLQGVPEIVDGCLVVGGSVVVWPIQDLWRAEAVIAVARAETTTPIDVGGGLLSSPDSIIVDRCFVSEVWIAAPANS